MPTYKLSYFDVNALGEPIRFMLSYMNQKFEDNRIKSKEWPAIKSSKYYMIYKSYYINDQLVMGIFNTYCLFAIITELKENIIPSLNVY